VTVEPPERLKEVLAWDAEQRVAARWRLFAAECDERRRRLWAAAEARTHGPGGVALVARATAISQETIRRGLAELDSDERLAPGRIRRPGGGRKPISETDPAVVEALERLVDPATRGDPDSPLRWTSKSLPKLRGALVRMGHQISADTVGELLRMLGYRLQANRKTREGSQHPDRDAQFEHINETVNAALASGEPVISVDTKKKELVGDFKNAGREWCPSGRPELVRVHDFKDKELGKAIPYGVYDVSQDEGFVSVGITADTAQFSVNAIRAWWKQLGHERHPGASTLTITADCGGSNGNRTRLWKTELQRLADETDLAIEVRHLPPGTSKWNKIEHRLFSFIAQNWRGRPLVSHEVIIELIAATTTSTGLTIYARLDETDYPKSVKVSDEQLAAVNLARHDWHPEWNYRIAPGARSP
jgi:Rhodopirellula transposase DDE domain